MTTTQILLWDVLPYVTIAVFVVGMFWRFRYDKFGWTTRSSQLYERSLLRIASPLFHLGMLAVVGGHVIGLMIPEDWTHAVGISEDMYHVNAIVVGGLAGGSGAVHPLGLPKDISARIEERLRAGDILISVHSDDPVVRERAVRVFKASGAEDIYYHDEEAAEAARNVSVRRTYFCVDRNEALSTAHLLDLLGRYLHPTGMGWNFRVRDLSPTSIDSAAQKSGPTLLRFQAAVEFEDSLLKTSRFLSHLYSELNLCAFANTLSGSTQ
jgi:hypothetical protein